jgi:acyl-coenzyme A thioesterase PaaI-like protein
VIRPSKSTPARVAGPLTLPPGAALDLDLVVAVATTTNLAHRRIGTELLDLGVGSATIGVDWPGFLGESSSFTNGLVTALLDHVCSIAALVALDDSTRFAGTIGLRVEYLHPVASGSRCTPTPRARRAPRPSYTFAAWCSGPKRSTSLTPSVRAPWPSPGEPPVTVDLYAEVIAAEPYFGFLGLGTHPPIDPAEPRPWFVLPAAEHHIGDARHWTVHGGVVAAFLESAAVITLRAEGSESPSTVVFTTDFVRGVRMVDTFAKVVVVRRGRRLAHVRVDAWQEQPQQLVALGTGSFTLA